MRSQRRWWGALALAGAIFATSLLAVPVINALHPPQHPQVTMPVLPFGRVACFAPFDAIPATTPPEITQARAEAIMRESYERKRIILGPLVEARYLSITASSLRYPPENEDPLRGHDVWEIGFAAGTNQVGYLLIDAHSGNVLTGCGDSH